MPDPSKNMTSLVTFALLLLLFSISANAIKSEDAPKLPTMHPNDPTRASNNQSMLSFFYAALGRCFNTEGSQQIPTRFFEEKKIFVEKPIEVKQGNAHAKSIALGSDNYLFTRDLSPCIGILIIDEHNQQCHLIHSDASDATSIGGKPLETIFAKLGLLPHKKYEIGLVGGSTDSLELEQKKIKKYLPHVTIKIIGVGESSAYLTGHGFMTSSKNELEKARDKKPAHPKKPF